MGPATQRRFAQGPGGPSPPLPVGCCWWPYARDHMAPSSAWSSRRRPVCLYPSVPAIRRRTSLDQGGLTISNRICKAPTSKYYPFPRFQVDVNLGGTIQPSAVGTLARYLTLFIKLFNISSGVSVSALPESTDMSPAKHQRGLTLQLAIACQGLSYVVAATLCQGARPPRDRLSGRVGSLDVCGVAGLKVGSGLLWCERAQRFPGTTAGGTTHTHEPLLSAFGSWVSGPRSTWSQSRPVLSTPWPCGHDSILCSP